MMKGVTTLAEEMLPRDIGEDYIDVVLPLRADLLLKMLGIAHVGDRTITDIQVDGNKVFIHLHGRFPVWAKDGDELGYTWANEIDATLLPCMDYARELQDAVVKAQREVDARWAERTERFTQTWGEDTA